MLEQTPNAAYLVASRGPAKFLNSVEYPIEIKFFSRAGRDGRGAQTADPAFTHSQNLSNYATSSLPYFDSDRDSVGVDRSDNPDITLKDLPIVDTLLNVG